MGHKKCSLSVREPPKSEWTTSNVVAWRTSSGHHDEIQTCCGATTEIKSYKKTCFEFCSVGTNQTDVLDCIKNTGVNTGVTYSKETSDAPASFHARPLSKIGFGIVLLLASSLMVGTI